MLRLFKHQGKHSSHPCNSNPYPSFCAFLL